MESDKTQSLAIRILSWRTFIVIIFHLAYCIFNIPVVTITMALVCMCGPLQTATNFTKGDNYKLNNLSNGTELSALQNENLDQEMFEFDWGAESRGLLISSYSFCVFLAPHLSNLLRGYLGNKMTLTAYAVILATLNFLSPLLARGSVYLFLATRVLSGLTVNSQIPICGDTLAWWMPAEEKLTAATIVILGWIVSGMLFPLFAGYLCLIPLDHGWPFIFYFNGTLCLLWAVTWYSLSSRRPENHPFISEAEKHYIISRRIGMDNVNSKEVTYQTPYWTILTSRPVWSFAISNVSGVWALVVVMTCLPLYLTSVQRMSLQEAGIVLFVLSGLRIPAAFFWTALGNWLKQSKSMTTTTVRKVCFCVGQGLAAIMYLATSFFDHQYRLLACGLVVVAVFVSTFGAALTSVIPLDMAPRYAGFLSAFGASFASLVSISAPIFVTSLASHGLFEEWRVVWLTMTAVHCTACAVFLLFGDASLQSWATSQSEEAKCTPISSSEGTRLDHVLLTSSDNHK